MIRVTLQPEPAGFDAMIRQRGKQALLEAHGALPPYWRDCLHELWHAYKGICAYVCIYIEPATGARSVDHFVCKSGQRELAYEWSNYRLACQLMNARKGVFDDVLDPFEIEDGWFHLDLLFCQIVANPDLDEALRRRVEQTIVRLDLNDYECREAREDLLREYEAGHVSLDFLERRSPFVARELKRQQAIR